MNDSLRTDVFVRFHPESIACACIFLAARTLEVGIDSAWAAQAPLSFQTVPFGSVQSS